MANLDDLIHFIKGNPPSSESYWRESDWQEQLGNSIVGWTDIAAKSFETSTEWEKIENVRPKKITTIYVKHLSVPLD